MLRPSPFPSRVYAPDIRVGRDEALYYCVKGLLEEGYQVFKRGFPTLVAVKNCQMRMLVLNPLVTFSPVVLGAGKDAMSDAFERCFGVKYEIWENPQPEEEPKSWI